MCKSTLTRRSALAGLGAGASSLLLRNFFSPSLASADDHQEVPLLIFAYFEGGWDTLLSLDPRDNTQYVDGGPIVPAYHLLDGIDVGPSESGIIKPAGSNIEFGPSIGELAAHYEDLCVLRGINMGTLTHEVGRRYFLTGKFPRGLQASGSALPTWVVNDTANATTLPNLVVANETYNEGLNPAASGISISSTNDFVYLMTQLEAGLGPNTTKAIDDYITKLGCAEQRLDSSGMVSVYQANKPKADTLVSGDLLPYFNFDAPNDDLQAAMAHFDYPNSNSGATIQAIATAQALKHGISQAVSISPASSIDNHDGDYITDHAGSLKLGFDSMGRLISFLKDNGLWQRTTMVLWSEFARTPKMNSRGGRDHHLANACVLAGGGIKGNQVIGATTDSQYASTPIDFVSGKTVTDTETFMRPPDVHATILEAMGLSSEHISNQSPQVIEAALKKA